MIFEFYILGSDNVPEHVTDIEKNIYLFVVKLTS